MHLAHASPRAFLFVGRFAELAALVAAAPPQAPVFHVATEGGAPPHVAPDGAPLPRAPGYAG